MDKVWPSKKKNRKKSKHKVPVEERRKPNRGKSFYSHVKPFAYLSNKGKFILLDDRSSSFVCWHHLSWFHCMAGVTVLQWPGPCASCLGSIRHTLLRGGAGPCASSVCLLFVWHLHADFHSSHFLRPAGCG